MIWWTSIFLCCDEVELDMALESWNGLRPKTTTETLQKTAFRRLAVDFDFGNHFFTRKMYPFSCFPQMNVFWCFLTLSATLSYLHLFSLCDSVVIHHCPQMFHRIMTFTLPSECWMFVPWDANGPKRSETVFDAKVLRNASRPLRTGMLRHRWDMVGIRTHEDHEVISHHCHHIRSHHSINMTNNR